jgi:hypothetical protein
MQKLPIVFSLRAGIFYYKVLTNSGIEKIRRMIVE